MALYYHLANVYKTSESKKDEVEKHIQKFLNFMPFCVEKLENSIDDKNYKKVVKYANEIIPNLELFGMDLALEDLHQIEKWCINKGKRKEIAEIFKSFKQHTSLAIKELKKDFINK